jgi:hypothetical protein
MLVQIRIHPVDTNSAFKTDEDLNLVPNSEEMTIFYTYPHGAKMTKNFRILTYTGNITIPYKKLKGNISRVIYSFERAQLTTKLDMYRYRVHASILIRIIMKTQPQHFASFDEKSSNLVKYHLGAN